MVAVGGVCIGGFAAAGAPSATITPCGSVTSTPVSAHSVPAMDLTSETRSTGHYAFSAVGLLISTEGATSTDKVAGYIATDFPLGDVGVPTLGYTSYSGTTPPGMQLLVNLHDGSTAPFFLVGEPKFYGDHWWQDHLTLPGVPAADGYKSSAPLQTYLDAFPNATVEAVGFSLGSGVFGDGLIRDLTAGCVKYTFGLDAPTTVTNTVTATETATVTATTTATATETTTASTTVTVPTTITSTVGTPGQQSPWCRQSPPRSTARQGPQR